MKKSDPKKLHGIPKRNIFTVPDGYFNNLPSIIQARTKEKESILSLPVFVGSLKYAIPAILIIIAVAIWIQSDNQSVTEQLLAEISTEEIIDYMQDSKMTSYELAEILQLSGEELTQILVNEFESLEELPDEDILLEYLDEEDLLNEGII